MLALTSVTLVECPIARRRGQVWLAVTSERAESCDGGVAVKVTSSIRDPLRMPDMALIVKCIDPAKTDTRSKSGPGLLIYSFC